MYAIRSYYVLRDLAGKGSTRVNGEVVKEKKLHENDIIEGGARITSYNVCYTKLLRSPGGRHGTRIGKPPQCEERSMQAKRRGERNTVRAA